ncbi:MAG: hypothetical protein ACI4MC_03610, partial [Candidatus Coproplasma sp.]
SPQPQKAVKHKMLYRFLLFRLRVEPTNFWSLCKDVHKNPPFDYEIATGYALAMTGISFSGLPRFFMPIKHGNYQTLSSLRDTFPVLQGRQGKSALLIMGLPRHFVPRNDALAFTQTA